MGESRRRRASRWRGARRRARDRRLSMPQPSSVTRIRPRPPPLATTSMRRAPASMAFSISSLTTLAGRSTTSPAAMRLTRFGGSWRMAIALPQALSAAQISARQELTRFYRRLVEGIDAQKRACENRLEHEMHHQSTKGALVKPFQHRWCGPAGRRRSGPRGWRAAAPRRDRRRYARPDNRHGRAARAPAPRADRRRRNARGSR